MYYARSTNRVVMPLDWTRILRDAGIPDSPGAAEAAAATRAAVAARKAAADDARRAKRNNAKPKPKRKR